MNLREFLRVNHLVLNFALGPRNQATTDAFSTAGRKRALPFRFFPRRKPTSCPPKRIPRGDAYCYAAIERHSIEGLRHAASASQGWQLNTDGFQPYISAITTTLSDRCDYAQRIKVCGQNRNVERRYSPAEVISSENVPVMGSPEKKRICISHIERQNLTIVCRCAALTRLTNAFSKERENLWSAYCLWFAYYNFCRVHQTLRVTPAMEAGLTGRIWKLTDLLS